MCGVTGEQDPAVSPSRGVAGGEAVHGAALDGRVVGSHVPRFEQLPCTGREVLGCLVVLALSAHAVLLAPNLEPLDPWLGYERARVSVEFALLFLVTGRVVLSFFPPGDVGSHAPRDLTVTVATSLSVGFVLSWLLPEDELRPYWLVPLLAIARWLTLPGAMVPRHPPPREPVGALDADSLMSGATILRLVRLMQAHPRLGILQSLVVGAPSSSAFARIFQFGMRHGMRAYTMGSAW